MAGDTPHDAVLRTEVALEILKLCFGMDDFHADNSDDLPRLAWWSICGVNVAPPVNSSHER